MSNLHSATELTEFAPLSPEEKQSGVTSIFSKIFRFSQDAASEITRHSKSQSPSPVCTPIEENKSSDASWKIINTLEADTAAAPESSTMVTPHQYSFTNSPVEARNLPNVLRRVSNLLALRKQNSVAYDDTSLKRYWMPDSVSKECYDCAEKFTTFRRRHHCRICGQIFCSQCCSQEVPGKIVGCSGNLRVCTYCCKVVLSYLQDADLSVDLKAVQDDLQSKFGDGVLMCEDDQLEEAGCSKSGLKVNNEGTKRKVSVVYQEEKFASGRSVDSSRHDDGSRKSELASLNILLHELTRSDNPLHIHTLILKGVQHDSCFTGSQLIDWLIYQGKTMSRTHSLAIGQVLLDANYIECISEQVTDFVDGLSVYRFCAVSSVVADEIDIMNNEHTQSSAGSTTRVSHSGFHLDINITKNTAHISRHPTKVTNSKDKKKTSSFGSDFTEEIINDFSNKYLRCEEINPTHWASVDENNLTEQNDEVITFRSLRVAFEQHLQNAVNQLLALENLSLSWSQIIEPLADQALREIKLDFKKTDIFNIGHYIQVKKLAGGERKDSKLIGGIVCTKNVAHREMCSRLANPRILLLQCSIVYQRVEGRLMSLEPVMMQEQEYLRHVIARIAALGPDLVLVHRNVSRLAQESLISHGITLVLNVKMSVMERVSRCTNADIVTSVDAYIGRTQLGTCRSFYTSDYTLKDGSTKNLMFFEGCAFPQLGCTILVRGASTSELKKLKTVINSVVFMKYNAKLEKSFLMDEFAKPPSVPSYTFIGRSSSKRVNNKPYDHNRELEVRNSKNDEVENVLTATSDPESGKMELPRKLEVEDKHTAAKSVVNMDDPLNLSGKADGEVFSQDIGPGDGNNLSFTEVPLKENKFKAALQDTVLSYSPFIEFNLPYLETTTGRTCELRKYFPTEVYYSVHYKNEKESGRSVSTDGAAQKIPANQNNIFKKGVHPLITAKLKDSVESENVQTLLASYRACGGRLEPNSKSSTALTAAQKSSNTGTKVKEMDFADPKNHQRLSVLFCSFSHYSNNSPEFCVNPWIVNMDFYGCNDIPLGSFLEKYCFRTSYMCPSETCETPMLDHERRFVHDLGCLHVKLNEVEALPDKNSQILCWSACTACKVITPIVTLSNDSWNLSFAKYLELRFHAGQYNCRADVAKSCNHSIHHDYCQYFYHRNILASFKYSDILRWEISLPQMVLQVEPLTLQTSAVLDEVKKWSVMGHEVFGSILEKLYLLDIDGITIDSLEKHLSKEQADFKQQVDDIQISLTSPMFVGAQSSQNADLTQKELFKIEDQVISMKKKVAKAVLNWNPLLTKLDSKRKEDRQKNKSISSDIFDSASLSSANTEELANASDELNITKDEVNSLEEGESNDFIITEMKKLENVDLKIGDKVDASLSQATETLPAVSQSQTNDKMSVKTLLLQLLPNTFQNNPSSLQNPINPEEHYLLNRTCSIPIVVYESEPSSMIAYALSSHHYQNALDDLTKITANSSDLAHKKVSKKESASGISVNSNNESPQPCEPEEVSKPEQLEEKTRPSKTSLDAHHLEIHFSDTSTNFTVKVYFADQFKEIRKLIFPAGEDTFVRSLSRCVSWAAHGGKSGSSFCKTEDDRFILKEMSRLEIQPFLDFAPHYVNFIRKGYVSQQPTLLVKIVGVYYVKYRNSVANSTFQSNLLVMENLFYMRDIIRKFDLKGSVRNRLVNMKDGHEGELVLLDENLINMTCVSPLYIYPHSKTVLLQAINNDVSFLASLSVMDYSLLVGLDETSQELVVGIIDYIRTFTWDKKLETMVKKSGILGGQGKLPTIVSPEEYKNRFIAAMHKYFLAVPDQWLGFGKGISY